jgi:hypothetical protein
MSAKLDELRTRARKLSKAADLAAADAYRAWLEVEAAAAKEPAEPEEQTEKGAA